MDRRQFGLEVGSALEELAIVLDPVEADLTPGCADLIEQGVRDRVSLGDEVPRRDEAVAPLYLEDLGDVPYPRAAPRRRG